MERQIRKLEAELHNKPDDFQVSVARRQAPTYKSFIKRSSNGEFLLTSHSLEIPTHEQASLEVLMADDGTSATLDSDQYAAGHSTRTRQGTDQQTPERLRIRYAPLIKTLEKVCRETLSNYHFWHGERESTGNPHGCSAAILLRPWKLLVAYEKEIRDSIHNIDAFVKPARQEDVIGGVAETQLLEDCEYYSPQLVIMNFHEPRGLKGFAPLTVLTSCFGFSRIQARRSVTGIKTACEVSRRGPQADFRSA